MTQDSKVTIRLSKELLEQVKDNVGTGSLSAALRAAIESFNKLGGREPIFFKTEGNIYTENMRPKLSPEDLEQELDFIRSDGARILVVLSSERRTSVIWTKRKTVVEIS